MIRPTTSFIVAMGGVFFALSVEMAVAAGDPARGANAFRACMVCHAVKPGEHMTGPSLADVWNRKAGTAEGFSRYSDALKGADLVWNDRNLDKWLANPEKLIPGNSMAFQGISNQQAREDIIAYLKAVSENKAPAATQDGGRMGMRSARPNLKTAPPEGQVTGISHCGDSYTVKTADEKTEKVWEFNLRFKTDSSDDGPLPGKPVIIGAGMRGDRASVVFAAPAEISSFIKQECP
jgi:cytochrome c